MNKTIKSDVRKLLYSMMSKFEEKQQKKQYAFDRKQQCLRVITSFIDNLNIEVSSIKEAVTTLTALEEEELIQTQSQYLEEISSMTGVSVATLKRIKKEGQVNCVHLEKNNQVWSLIKRKIASKNINLPSAEVERIIRESVECVTPQDWKKNTDHVVHVENTYKVRDTITDEELEPFIINVCDDSSDSDASLEIEFSDSDFDYDS